MGKYSPFLVYCNLLGEEVGKDEGKDRRRVLTLVPALWR